MPYCLKDAHCGHIPRSLECARSLAGWGIWLESMAACAGSSSSIGGKSFLRNALSLHWFPRRIHMGRIQAKRTEEPLEKWYTGYKAVDWEQVCRANAIRRLSQAESGIRSSGMDHGVVMHPVAWKDESWRELLVDEGVIRRSDLDDDASVSSGGTELVDEVSEDGRIVPPERVQEIELKRALLSEEAKKAGPGFRREDILYEDEYLMVVNKPPGVYAGHVLRTAIHFMGAPCSSAYPLAELPPEISGCKPHLLSKLDRDTSGVILVSKTTKATSELVRAFASQRVDKSYVALCAGELPGWSNLTIQSGHGRSRVGTLSVYPKREVGKKLALRKGVQEMVTTLKVLGSWKPTGGEVQRWIPGDDGHSEVLVVGEDVPVIRGEVEQGTGSEILLQANPMTGRTHQTRLHCQYLGLPLLGDIKYGGPLEWNGVRYNHQTLHAHTSTFKHPITQELLHLVAPLPDWANKFLLPPPEAPSSSGWTSEAYDKREAPASIYRH